MSNYQTGIDIGFGGSQGVDWEIERLFHDPLTCDRAVYYVKAATAISLTHNARNVAWLPNGTETIIGVNGQDGIPNSGDEGIIRYKLDKDLAYGLRWGDGTGTTILYDFNHNPITVPLSDNPAYVYGTPFTLASQEYESGVPVVGTTGPKPGKVITDWGNYYWRGVLDTLGDEWHTMQVADDDSLFHAHGTSADNEWSSSDGKIYTLVVNPKTPCLSVAVTGNAQFYTTVPKAYFVPKICPQTTYFAAGTGTISFSLRDINGNNVFYRINGGAWSAGAANPVLTAADFASGTNTLEYYYAGNQAYTKTRTVVNDPAFPSAGESHGHLLWGTGNLYNDILRRIANVDPIRSNYEDWKTASFFNAQDQFDAFNGLGLRNGISVSQVYSPTVTNAFIALTTSWTTVPPGKTLTYAQYAKQMLLQSVQTIDPVGFEINHSSSRLPTRELFYRGYYDVMQTFDAVFAYDILIAGYKSTQVTGGITAIEDYYVRDLLASAAYQAMLQIGNFSSQEYTTTGMWGTARQIGGLMVALALPTYSTPYYGTSGIDGNTTTYPWTPFPDTPLTWKKTFLDNDSTLVGYPNLNYRLGVQEYLVNSDGQWLDRVGYFGTGNMGNPLFILGNVTKLNTAVTYPWLEHAYQRASDGTLMGVNYPEEGTQQFDIWMTWNQRFANSDIAGSGAIAALAANPTGDTPETQDFKRNYAYGGFWYEGLSTAPGSPRSFLGS